jgi:hypothetical protein
MFLIGSFLFEISSLNLMYMSNVSLNVCSTAGRTSTILAINAWSSSPTDGVSRTVHSHVCTASSCRDISSKQLLRSKSSDGVVEHDEEFFFGVNVNLIFLAGGKTYSGSRDTVTVHVEVFGFIIFCSLEYQRE